MQTHAFLPYRERHMEAIACQTCHIAAPMAPAAEMVDETVATLDGRPVITWRNLERRDGEALNAALIRPLQPLLLMRAVAGGPQRLSPVNVVSRYRWVSRANNSAVPFEKVAAAVATNGVWAKEILAAFDADGDGKLSARELRADTAFKAEAVATRLRALGMVDPVVEGIVEVHPLAHGVSARDHAQRDCAACHSERSRLGEDYPIAAYLPGGQPPRPPEGGGRIELSGSFTPTGDGGLLFRHAERALPGGLHVLGYSREAKTNLVGFALFLAVSASLLLHGLLRLVMHRKAGAEHSAPAKQAYVFGRYERLWHWTMALSGIMLIATGLEVHNPGGLWPVSLAGAVALHNAFAVALMFNAFLALFYHLATSAIRNFIPRPEGLLGRIVEHVQFQSRGIFYGSPHPLNDRGQKLNPLQQLTYLALLNVLFPVQIGSGIAIWAVGHWPAFGALVGGLSILAPLHNLGSWLFLTFFVLHVYLVTTGRTVGEHLRSMVTGYQPVEPEPSAVQGE
jgi:thiosulfate reductase cytochrome b subunit